LIQSGFTPHAINFSQKAIDGRYLNKRAEMWFLLSEWVKRGGVLSSHPEIARELASATYCFMNGKFKLEDKAQIKSRLGYSPDIADALALTFALPEMPSDGSSLIWYPGKQEKKMISDYDPFSEDRMAK
jgi:hypothetical protein